MFYFALVKLINIIVPCLSNYCLRLVFPKVFKKSTQIIVPKWFAYVFLILLFHLLLELSAVIVSITVSKNQTHKNYHSDKKNLCNQKQLFK